MRIERHTVAEKTLAEAVEDFAGRIAGQVRGEQHAPRGLSGWELIGDDLHDFAAACSARRPEVDGDAQAAPYSAGEAYTGELRLGALPSEEPLSVHISFTGTGVSYQGMAEEELEGSRYPVRESDWARALYLFTIAGLEDRVVPVFMQAGGAVSDHTGLARALAGYLFRELEEPRGEVLADLEAAGEPAGDAALLRALLARDEKAFWLLLAERLTAHRDACGEGSPARTLLPIAPLAYTAMAVRIEGWEQRIESDYLPAQLIAGFPRE
ncbi:Imm49 family immunity protein [Nocardiopsis composta]|uniref:Immunity protein 49 of polymorphic toxin system n=1 Tax=Nocardiopsis composta TaxID=157465 RepID=A0A7W8VBI5_9ACTN|nr:Imm49 family immunity protein [Nocardiopsis composta]MBB5430167.1 hypothetical protein [Nocardiopsis composta]